MSSSVVRKLSVRPAYAARSTPDAISRKLARYRTVTHAVRALLPHLPLRCLDVQQLQSNAADFLKNFPGKTYYAVKANPEPVILQELYRAGVRNFDVASLEEIRLLRSLLPAANLAFMHPVKGREAIREAYYTYNVRTMVLDSFAELEKIRQETAYASDLTLVVRLAMPKGTAACSLTGKFGVAPEQAVKLLRATSESTSRLGLSFHVGSQTLDPETYRQAIDAAARLIADSGIRVDIFDVGGGFPVQGLGDNVPQLGHYFSTIRAALHEARLPPMCEIWCEPGRALVATAETLVARVELRKGNTLYLNDGSYGNMFEVASMRWRNHVERIKQKPMLDATTQNLTDFSCYGPTCDSIDFLSGPFRLPDDVAEGDWLAFASMGAYGSASQTRFNGFYANQLVLIDHKAH